MRESRGTRVAMRLPERRVAIQTPRFLLHLLPKMPFCVRYYLQGSVYQMVDTTSSMARMATLTAPRRTDQRILAVAHGRSAPRLRLDLARDWATSWAWPNSYSLLFPPIGLLDAAVAEEPPCSPRRSTVPSSGIAPEEARGESFCAPLFALPCAARLRARAEWPPREGRLGPAYAARAARRPGAGGTAREIARGPVRRGPGAFAVNLLDGDRRGLDIEAHGVGLTYPSGTGQLRRGCGVLACRLVTDRCAAPPSVASSQ